MRPLEDAAYFNFPWLTRFLKATVVSPTALARQLPVVSLPILGPHACDEDCYSFTDLVAALDSGVVSIGLMARLEIFRLASEQLLPATGDCDQIASVLGNWAAAHGDEMKAMAKAYTEMAVRTS